MDVFRFQLERETLDAVPAAERTLFLLLGHFANQAAILGKWANWCSHFENLSNVEYKGRVAQSLFVLTLLSGKLCEGWELLQSCFFGNALSKIYEPKLSDDARQGLQELKGYFGKDNLLRKVRNEYAFHYDPDALQVHYGQLPKDEACEVFLSDAVGYNLFHIAEMATGHAMLVNIGNGDAQAGMDKLVVESLRVSGWFQMFVGGFFYAFFQTHWKTPPNPVQEDVGALKEFDEVEIPFLAEH